MIFCSRHVLLSLLTFQNSRIKSSAVAALKGTQDNTFNNSQDLVGTRSSVKIDQILANKLHNVGIGFRIQGPSNPDHRHSKRALKAIEFSPSSVKVEGPAEEIISEFSEQLGNAHREAQKPTTTPQSEGETVYNLRNNGPSKTKAPALSKNSPWPEVANGKVGHPLLEEPKFLAALSYWDTTPDSIVKKFVRNEQVRKGNRGAIDPRKASGEDVIKLAVDLLNIDTALFQVLGTNRASWQEINSFFYSMNKESKRYFTELEAYIQAGGKDPQLLYKNKGYMKKVNQLQEMKNKLLGPQHERLKAASVEVPEPIPKKKKLPSRAKAPESQPPVPKIAKYFQKSDPESGKTSVASVLNLQFVKDLKRWEYDPHDKFQDFFLNPLIDVPSNKFVTNPEQKLWETKIVQHANRILEHQTEFYQELAKDIQQNEKLLNSLTLVEENFNAFAHFTQKYRLSGGENPFLLIQNQSYRSKADALAQAKHALSFSILEHLEPIFIKYVPTFTDHQIESGPSTFAATSNGKYQASKQVKNQTDNWLRRALRNVKKLFKLTRSSRKTQTPQVENNRFDKLQL
ncbi:hypothetical protein CROQUDRAFT_643437 [Cronartium quercuum f. sp. fusiforme G11]|uniref:Uncharacterized protein n=1 Tax=Cronartium quercuum f. sp. fusiforme G11 TaxID=708437 RepID=A0A9P6NHC6_9BASI|nr:hypothetical protein CROQUDRAFT_643437 [Cronartium quercuum f. sp. fusiforme G11]